MAYQRGSGFVGLQQYLAPNMQTAQRLGQGVVGQVQGAIDTAHGAGEATVNEFQQEVDSGVPQYVEPGSIEEAQSRAGGAGGTVYRGPQALDPSKYAALQTQADEAGKTAALGTTDAGVATLLQQQHGNGYVGVGGRSLDSFLARRGAGEALDTAASTGMDNLRAYLGQGVTERTSAAVEGGMERSAGVRRQYAAWRPAQTIDEGPKRNQIQTPGTMPDKAPRRQSPFNRLGRWLFTGGG